MIGACICSNDVNVCGSAHCGCVVNGSVAMAAFEYDLFDVNVCGTAHCGCVVKGSVAMAAF